MKRSEDRAFLWRQVFVCLLAMMLIQISSKAFGYQSAREDSQTSNPTAEPVLVAQLGHSDSVLSAIFSPDEKYILTAGSDSTAVLWDVETGREIRRFGGRTFSTTGSYSISISARFSPDGKYVLTTGNDSMAHLWEIDSGKEVKGFQGHSDFVNSAVFSSDGKYVLTASDDKTARMWQVESGREIRKFEGHSDLVSSAIFSPDGKYVLTVSRDETARLWNIESGREVRQMTGIPGRVSSVTFSSSEKQILAVSFRTVQLWDIESGKEMRRFEGDSNSLLSAVSLDGKYALTGSDFKIAHLWHIETGRELRRFAVQTGGVASAVFSPDNRYVLIMSLFGSTHLWEVESGRELHKLENYRLHVGEAIFSLDGKSVLIEDEDGTMRLWEVESGKEIRKFGSHSGGVRSSIFSLDGKYVFTLPIFGGTPRIWDIGRGKQAQQLGRFSVIAFSPGGKYVLTREQDDTSSPKSIAALRRLILLETENGREIRRFEQHFFSEFAVIFSPDEKYILTINMDGGRLWEIESGREIRKFENVSSHTDSATFSPDGKYVLAASGSTAQLWEVESGREIRRFKGHSDKVNLVSFSSNGKYALTASYDGTARLWDVEIDQEIRKFERHDEVFTSASLSPDGKYLLTCGWYRAPLLWQTETGKIIRRFEGHPSIVSAVFSPDGNYVLTAGWDGTARLWSTATGKELCQLISFRDGSWAVIDQEGRYDASNNGEVEGLHWVIGNEPIDLSQLKQRYYEPGLLAKTMKGEPLRDVSAFTDPKLFPEVIYYAPAQGSTRLKINLRNRGGGIGKVVVFVNGKELTADARASSRGLKINPSAKEAELTVELALSPFLKPGEQNEIRVLAYNQEGYLSSRGPRVIWDAPGKAQKDPPALYAIIGGTSTYKSDGVSLRYASKDAEDMARAIRLGAKSLFGTEKVNMTVLSSSGKADTVRPTKENFRKAFKQAHKAKPGDVLLIYLAGHGLAVRFTNEDETYCYLTEEWRGSTDLKDEAIRKEQSITSDELVEWIKEIPALKQIMILDTCAAGAVAEKIKLVDRRLPSSDQIRAIDRLKDRTGFHVLMGSAADKASYETSQYSQGLLTYALLEGIKYAAVKNEIVEVSPLFQYARDRVPDLAKSIGIGGVQQPQIMAPKGDSFPVARITARESEEIILASEKPLVVRPRIINPEDASDDELEKIVRRELREESEPVTRGSRGRETRMVYLDDGELPSAVRPSGIITVEGEVMKVKMTLRRGDLRTNFDIEGRVNDKAGVATKIVEAIAKALETFR